LLFNIIYFRASSFITFASYELNSSKICWARLGIPSIPISARSTILPIKSLNSFPHEDFGFENEILLVQGDENNQNLMLNQLMKGNRTIICFSFKYFDYYCLRKGMTF
jgi:hypothetical protein